MVGPSGGGAWPRGPPGSTTVEWANGGVVE